MGFHDLLHRYPSLTVHAIFYLFIWTCPYPGGAGAGAGGSQCDLQPRRPIPFQGTFEGDSCSTMPGSVSVCTIQCEAVPQCKLIFSVTCPAPENCVCGYCTTIKSFDLTSPASRFFLNTVQIATNQRDVQLAGGLVPGQPLLMDITLTAYKTSLNFITSNGQIAFMTEIRFNEFSVVSNSYINNVWGAENRYTPHFNFQQGQTLKVVCHVTSAKYSLFLKATLFKDFPHRITDLRSITRFELISPGYQSKLLSFQR